MFIFSYLFIVAQTKSTIFNMTANCVIVIYSHIITYNYIYSHVVLITFIIIKIDND